MVMQAIVLFVRHVHVLWDNGTFGWQLTFNWFKEKYVFAVFLTLL